MLKINLQLFGRVYDLTEDLSSEPATIKVGTYSYEIKAGFKTVMEIDKLFKDNKPDPVFVKQFLKIALGEKASNELISMNKPIAFYKKIIRVIGDELRGGDDESDSGMSE